MNSLAFLLSSSSSSFSLELTDWLDTLLGGAPGPGSDKEDEGDDTEEGEEGEEGEESEKEAPGEKKVGSPNRNAFVAFAEEGTSFTCDVRIQ
mmetsp:Transcript_16790/g.28666  ORF Transcript_16790/g.28666 Transcript_16790/m.28666 type:complete len:92 (+) Transcript_16790:270-545(+)